MRREEKMDKLFLTQLRENNGEVFIELPSEFLKSCGWSIDDAIGFQISSTSIITVHNLTKRDSKKPYLDTSIIECKEAYEEEIELYKTYGGD